MAAVLEYPKLMQISNIHLKSDDLDTATEIKELQELVLTAWETIEEAGYQGHNEELKEKVEELQGSIGE